MDFLVGPQKPIIKRLDCNPFIPEKSNPNHNLDKSGILVSMAGDVRYD